MKDSTTCKPECANAASIAWPVVGVLVVLLSALNIYARSIAKRRAELHRREIRQPVETGQVDDEEGLGETTRVLQRGEAVEDADFEDRSRMQKVGEEVAALAILSSKYRNMSTRRRYLSRKIICNTVVEVSRCHKDLKISAILAGSTQEGLGDTLQPIQYFQASKRKKYSRDIERGLCDEYAKRPLFSCDVDVMIVPLALSVGTSDDLEYEHVQSKPLSFVKLKPSAEGKLGNLRDCLTDGGYLSAKSVKKLLQEALEHARDVYCGPSVAVAVEEHGVAVEMKWAEPSVDGEFCETVLIADFTFALRMPHWPRCALDWTERARNWPSRHLTAAVAAGGCHAVAFYRDSSDDECQWRLSFSRAELILFSALPPYARDMCIALKALFKSRIQPHCPSLSSYHLKTVVLWIMEQAPPNLFSSSESTAVALFRSLTLLKDFVREGRMSHYFVSGHNILPFMSQCEVKKATNAILDAALYTDHHLASLRTSEGKYFCARDYNLVQLPGEILEPKSAVQCVIKRQLNDILNAIPDVFEAAPITVPKYPVLVHLLTGRVVKLAFSEVLREICWRKYFEIREAVVQENVNSVKDVGQRFTVEVHFRKAFARELVKGLVYDTEHSLENAHGYASKVEVYRTAIRWIALVSFALSCVLGISAGLQIYYCWCPDANSSTEQSQTDYSSSSDSSSLYGGGQSSSDSFNSNVNGAGAVITLVGGIKGGTKVLSDVNIKLRPSRIHPSIIRG